MKLADTFYCPYGQRLPDGLPKALPLPTYPTLNKSMDPNIVYELLIDAMEEHLPPGWSIARLNVQFITNGQDVEFAGTYLDATGEPKPLTTDFPEQVIEAVQGLYQRRKTDGHPKANTLQVDLTAAGQYTTVYGWDQEIQDEEDYFNQGGTAREWTTIRDAKYGPSDHDNN